MQNIPPRHELVTERRRNMMKEEGGSGYTVLKTMQKAPGALEDLKKLPVTTKKVHINGLPLLHILQALIRELPHLTHIRIAPRNQKNFGKSHRALLIRHGIGLSIGTDHPGGLWKGDESGPKHGSYYRNKKFFQKLTPDQQRCFDELKRIGNHSALIASRYLCLGGEAYVPMNELADQPGYEWSSRKTDTIAQQVGTVMRYLDPKSQANEEVLRRVRTLEKEVAAAKSPAEKAAEELKRKLADHGIDWLPNGIPDKHVTRFAMLYRLHKTGELNQKLGQENPNLLVALVARYGLSESSSFMTHDQVARTTFGGSITRQCVYYYEVEALTILGIRE